MDTGKPADVQNNLTSALNTEPVLVTVLDTVSDGKKVTFTPEIEGEYYAYTGGKSVKKVKATTWKGSKTFDNTDRGYLVELGYCEAGEEVVLEAEEGSDFWADVYRFSESGLKAVYEKLSAKPWVLSSWTDTSLEGTISCEESGLMMTTIPYDEGWRVNVDGVEQPPGKDAGCIYRCEADAGKPYDFHEIQSQRTDVWMDDFSWKCGCAFPDCSRRKILEAVSGRV